MSISPGAFNGNTLNCPSIHTVPLSLPDGKAVVRVAYDAVVRLYDADNGKELRWFRIDSVEAKLSPDGRWLVAVGSRIAAPDGRSETGDTAPSRCWDLTKPGDQKPVRLSESTGSSPVFSPDGRVLAFVVRNWQEITFVDMESKKEFRRIAGDEGIVRNLAFSPDGKRLVAGYDSLTALVWDVSR